MLRQELFIIEARNDGEGRWYQLGSSGRTAGDQVATLRELREQDIRDQRKRKDRPTARTFRLVRVTTVAEVVPEDGSAPPASAQERICAEVQEIMAEYDRQALRGFVDTPGGLEHMGDVWRMFTRWVKLLGDTK